MLYVPSGSGLLIFGMAGVRKEATLGERSSNYMHDQHWPHRQLNVHIDQMAEGQTPCVCCCFCREVIDENPVEGQPIILLPYARICMLHA